MIEKKETEVAEGLSASDALTRELAARELARRRLIPFVVRTLPTYRAGWVHKDIAARLEKFSDDVAKGLSPRLMIQMPPRSGKSELASVRFPAWHLGQYPVHEIISCSYALALARTFSRKARDLLKEGRYQSLFKTRLDPDAQNVEHWMTTEGGGLSAAGVNGPVTGKGAHILLIDDPIKNAEEAESEAHLESIREWYTSTAYTRLAPGGGVLIIQTRWADGDLSGWLEAQSAAGEGDEFEIVRYPAIAVEDETYRKKGEALHPERYDLDALKRIRRAVGPTVWQALYQQNPVAAEGEYFKRDSVRYYDTLPPVLRPLAAWDLAIGKKESNDWTVGLVGGVDPAGDLYLMERYRGRWDSFEIVEAMIDCQRTFNPSVMGIEQGQIKLAIGPYLEQRIQEEKLYALTTKELAPGRRDKQTRARTIQGLLRQGKVFFPRHAEWVEELIQEMLRFPKGLFDDQVDALAYLGLMAIEETPPPAGRRPSGNAPKSWRERLLKAHGRYRSAMSS